MLPLTCGFQQYAWGKTGTHSKVARMVGKADDVAGRYAELWIGTHPSKPSKLAANGALLKDAISADAATFLGGVAARDYVAKYGADIPFLLKVLSVDTALSVQAHPERGHAKQLHARDPKNYPDPNHKPELVVALTPYRALCCFRPLTEIAGFLKAIPSLRNLVAGHEAIINAGNTPAVDAKPLLKAALESIYSASADALEAAISQHLANLGAAAPASLSEADVVFKMLTEQYPNDVGCWMVYLLNLVNLNPGDALFLGPNEPHSYLSGDSVEIMACSDNVVRAGLTPKFKDVPTLIDMLTYRTDSLAEAHTANNNAAVQQYAPPAWCDEFMLTAVRSSNGATQTVKLPSIGLGVVTDGAGTVNGVDVQEGATFVVPAESAASGVVVRAADGGSLTVFIATVNNTAAAAKL